MRSKILAAISVLLFVCSYVYFLYVRETIYNTDVGSRYFIETLTALAIPVGLSLFLALVIWLFKRHSYVKYLFRSLVSFCIAGVCIDLFATYLMFWSAGQ